MGELSLMMTIANKVNSERLRKLYEQKGASVCFSSFGRGTASSRVLDILGLEKSEKAILLNVIDGELFPAIKRDLERKFLIDIPGTGIVFLIPISAVGGKKPLQMLLGEQEFLKGDESEMKNTEQELIIVIANQGYSEAVMEAARSAKAGGGTVVHAKGTGNRGSEKFFGFSIAAEKELIYIVVPGENRSAVMRAIMDEAGLKAKAQAVCFSLPVTATAGMRLIPLMDEEEN